MSHHQKSKHSDYTIRIRGRLPSDLGDKISRLHAAALLDDLNSTRLKLDDEVEVRDAGQSQKSTPDAV